MLSFTDVIVKSSNVGAIKVGLKLGAERLGAYVKRFGFGRRTSPDFPGESAGIVWDPAKLTDSALASVSMGYQVGVTPLQMAAAVSSIANGGELFEPRIVRAVIRDGARTPVPRKVVRRTVTARHGRDADARSWKRSSSAAPGRARRSPAYTVAGKTGTAQKVVERPATRAPTTTRRSSGSCRRASRCSRSSWSSTRRTGRNLLLRRLGRGADLPADRRRGAAAPGRSAVAQPGAAGARRAARRSRASSRRRVRPRLPAIVTLAGTSGGSARALSGPSRPGRARCAADARAARA